jgi:hypothetical protein
MSSHPEKIAAERSEQSALSGLANSTCYDYDCDDPSFIADLRESKSSVEIAARWLSSQGYPVVIRPTFERPESSKMAEFADDGDLEIMQRVEVKRRVSLTFSSKADFPYKTLIVDACHCYDNARPKPYAYIILNREMSAAFIVDVKASKKHWQKVTKQDRFKKRERSFYEVPMEFVRVEEIKS